MIKNNSITMMKIKLLKMKMINKMINSLITIQKNMKLKMMIKNKNQIILKKMNKNISNKEKLNIVPGCIKYLMKS